MCVWGVCAHMPQHIYRGQRLTLRSLFSHSTMWVPRFGGACPFLLSHHTGKFHSFGFCFSWLLVLCFVYNAKDQTQSQASVILLGQPSGTWNFFDLALRIKGNFLNVCIDQLKTTNKMSLPVGSFFLMVTSELWV